jgi:hypothetical protein
MANNRLLEGNVDERDQIIRALEDRVQVLEGDLAVANAERDRAQATAIRAVGNLRNQLTPLFQALKMVFGEMDAVAPAGVAVPGQEVVSTVSPRELQVWEAWKKKMPGKAAEFIDILLTHGEMNAAQLKIAGKCASDTVYQTIHRLHKAGLINKNGGKVSLKKL